MEGARRDRQRQAPWLLTSHGKHNEKHSFYNLVESRFHAKNIPELRNKCMCISTYDDGWLVLVDYSGECCIWNPESMAKIELPSLHNPLDYNKCVLSKPPRDPECHILFTSICGFTRAFCKIGDSNFVIEEVDDANGLDLLAVAVSNGQVYGFMHNGFRCNRLVTVHFAEKALEFRPIMITQENGGEPKHWDISHLWRPYITGWIDYMMESPYENQLLLICQTYSYSFLGNIFDFRVFRLDMDKMECTELENLDDISIFLTYRQGGVCVCCSSSTGIQKNCIYYTDSNGRDLYIYDYTDRGKTMLLPCPVAKLSQSRNFWIQHHKFIN